MKRFVLVILIAAAALLSACHSQTEQLQEDKLSEPPAVTEKATDESSDASAGNASSGNSVETDGTGNHKPETSADSSKGQLSIQSHSEETPAPEKESPSYSPQTRRVRANVRNPRHCRRIPHPEPGKIMFRVQILIRNLSSPLNRNPSSRYSISAIGLLMQENTGRHWGSHMMKRQKIAGIIPLLPAGGASIWNVISVPGWSCIKPTA